MGYRMISFISYFLNHCWKIVSFCCLCIVGSLDFWVAAFSQNLLKFLFLIHIRFVERKDGNFFEMKFFLIGFSFFLIDLGLDLDVIFILFPIKLIFFILMFVGRIGGWNVALHHMSLKKVLGFLCLSSL